MVKSADTGSGVECQTVWSCLELYMLKGQGIVQEGCAKHSRC